MSKVDQTDTASSETALEASLTKRFREIGILSRSLLETEDALERERAEHEVTRLALKKAQYNASRGYDAVIASTSWRVTAPLRWIVRRLRRR